MRAAKEVDRGSYCDIRTPWFLRSARFLAVATGQSGLHTRVLAGRGCDRHWYVGHRLGTRALAERSDLFGAFLRALWSRVSCDKKMKAVVFDSFDCRN
jgi:hypothetical protein